ncbi:MAG: PVC-type heme-binding CxxCH protein [Gemmataceae bacterium]
MKYLPLLALLLPTPLLAQEKTPPEGVLPKAADGRSLNLDFETGDLRDWTATGDAFKGQPIKGDTVHPRRGDMKSEHQGQYWIGGYEKLQDKPTGTLTSVPFKVTHPWGSFLVGGGPHEVTCVELVRKDTGLVFHRSSGLEEENLRRVAVDLKPHMGKEIFIRLVDKHTGHWGHVNFDDFRFHSDKPLVLPRPKLAAPPPADEYKFAGLPPDKAAAAMTVPEGFEVKLFAGEPDITQPIAFCMDDRARLWVVESRVYPQRKKTPGWKVEPKEQGDRILIFEDTDGDGRFDKRTVFMEGLNLVSGIEYGFGGLWVGAAPYLLFIPIDAKTDQPADEPKVLLDGFGWHDTHETLNAFNWGPDGWLYGCHGVFTHSKVGKPGTAEKDRIPMNAAVWRYHPTRHVFEVFAHGTSNPWGLDFDEHGQAFVEACVIPHCFHIIQGARYERQANTHFNPHTYADIKTIADHLHWQGANPWAGNNRSDSMGGGHAHCGLMVYLGGAWPEKYHNQLFMGNIHGRRLNMDVLKPKGSGYVASHGPDFLMANDAWARFINMRYGPDGNVYLLDWYDKQACHSGDTKIWDRSNGRIYKVCFRGTKWEKVDLAKKSSEELFQLQADRNDWYVRHARRLLQERGSRNPKLFDEVSRLLHPARFAELPAKQELRQRLWALHVLVPKEQRGWWQKRCLATADGHLDAHVRAWAIQLAVETMTTKEADEATFFFHNLALDASPVVRLYMASAMQRVSFEDKGLVLKRLLSHAEDNTDHNLPLMYWYAAEPLADADAKKALDLALDSKIDIILPFMTRRIASSAKAEDLALVLDCLLRVKTPERQQAMLGAIQLALKGRPKVAMPDNWPKVYAALSRSESDSVKKTARSLAVTFGDAKALDGLRLTLADTKADAETRAAALETLLAVKDTTVGPMLVKLLDEAPLRGPAIRGLAGYNLPETPERLLKLFGTLSAAEKRDALATLSARPAFAHAMLDAIGKKRLAAAEVSADVIRSLRNLGDASLEKKIGDVWGSIRATPADRAKQMKEMKFLVLGPGPTPDLALGRALFKKTCYQCHKLFGEGGVNGPEITGANRGNLDYLIENIVDPSAVIPKEYAVSIIELESGRFITGIKKSETPAAYVIATATETLTIPRGDVLSMKPTSQSLMPDDQLKPMSPHEVRSLIAYLQSPTQTPILATPENAADLFNGKDLTGWTGDPKLWSVEKGEIVGKSPGIKHNTFLRSHMTMDDFRLTVKVKLTPNKENSGIQFRSKELPSRERKRPEDLDDTEMQGYQADVGAGWWGKLYEENGRGLLTKEGGEKYVKVDDWNEYKIEAIGTKVRTWINGNLCVDIDDAKGALRGILALQIHAGGPMEVRFKEFRLEVLKK